MRAGCWLLLALLSACDAAPEPTAEPRPSAALTTPGVAVRRPEFVPAQAASGEGGKEIVLRELQRAERDGVKLLIYVGATWCEPCQVFHAAIEQGRLDKELGNVRFLELDHDRDAALLTDTSCISDMIPLFAVPTQDGRCSGRRTEGGVKGDAAVGYLTPKVKALLSAAP